MKLTELITAIQSTHEYTQQFAVQQVNVALTIRNWLIGFCIVEYEQDGENRAEYGARLLPKLAKALKVIGLKGLDDRSLRDCSTFYQIYPQIWGTVSPKLQEIEKQYGIKNNWTVRELERAMSTLLFERMGLSTNKEAVIAQLPSVEELKQLIEKDRKNLSAILK